MEQKIPLAETDIYLIFKTYEDVFLFDKENNRELWHASFYGDANVGLLGVVNDWAIVGGDRLLVWKNDLLKFIEDPDLVWIHDIRQVGDDEVEILTDPWGDQPAIWWFDVMSEEKVKIRDFEDYKGKEYVEDVVW